MAEKRRDYRAKLHTLPLAEMRNKFLSKDNKRTTSKTIVLRVIFDLYPACKLRTV